MSAPTIDELEEYVACKSEAAELSRKARERTARAKVLEAEFAAWLGDKSSRKRHGFTLRQSKSPGSVSWKDAFVELAGVEAADRLKAEADPRTKIEVLAP
ncbi:MAG: hypothetical protein AAFZ07_20100 [Actinomycetota bacterium]